MKKIITIAIAFVFTMAVAGSVSASTVCDGSSRMPVSVWQESRGGILFVWTSVVKSVENFYKSFANPSDYKGECTRSVDMYWREGMPLRVSPIATTTPAI